MIYSVSIIIPTYNQGNYLLKAIESVRSQKQNNWELVIVNDGSTDDTREILHPFMGDSKIKIFHTENHGVSSARNTGLANCSNDFVIFLDADDQFEEFMLSTINSMNFWNYDLTTWYAVKLRNHDKSIWKPRKLGPLYNNYKVSFLSGTVCYRKCIIENVGGFDKNMSFGENYELGIRLTKSKLKIKIIPETLIKIFVANQRISNSLNNRIFSTLYQYKKHIETFNRYPKENSKMLYLIGFLFHKKSKLTTAYRFYSASFFRNNFNYKAFFRVIQTKYLLSI